MQEFTYRTDSLKEIILNPNNYEVEEMENYSLSDIAAITGGENFNSNSFIWIFALLILFGGGFGFGNKAGLSQQDLLINTNFDNLARNVQSISDRQYEQANNLTKGLCELGYSTSQQINGVQGAIADVKAAVHAEGEATRSMISQNKIESLQAEVNELKTQQMFCGVPKINPYMYGVYPYNNGCNCGNV